MDNILPVRLLRWIKTGRIELSENEKKTIEITFRDDKINVNIIDFSFKVSRSKGVFARLSKAREFAKKLQEKNLTLIISHKNKIVMKLGREAKPKISKLITRSNAVEITNLRELRRLDKRLRLK